MRSYSCFICKVRGSPRLPLLLTPVANLGVPKTTLKFDNLLEGLTELTESCFTHGYSLLQQNGTD